MYVFGGILELTKELNELLVFDFDTKEFRVMGGSSNNEDALKEMSNVKTREEDHSPTLKRGMNNKQSTYGSPSKGGKSPQKNMLRKTATKSPMKKKEETHHDKKESGLASPTSISMQNSFIIKNADDSFDAYYKQMKTRKMGGLGMTGLDPITMHSSMPGAGNSSPGVKESHFGVVPGIQPAARDGHTTDISESGCMFVFGGDRHHMPFNDLYMLKLD